MLSCLKLERYQPRIEFISYEWTSAKRGLYSSKNFCFINGKKVIRKSVYITHVIIKYFEKERFQSVPYLWLTREQYIGLRNSFTVIGMWFCAGRVTTKAVAITCRWAIISEFVKEQCIQKEVRSVVEIKINRMSLTLGVNIRSKSFRLSKKTVDSRLWFRKLGPWRRGLNLD